MTMGWMNQLISEFSRSDDVFNGKFLEIIVFFGSHSSETIIEGDVPSLFDSWKTRQYILASLENFDSEPMPGPYVIKDGYLWQAQRLYNDTNGAFLTACLPADKRWSAEARRAFADSESMLTGSSSYRRLGLEGEEYGTLSVAVPFRLSRKKTAQLPLAGTRIAVKDIFDIASLITSIGSRGYFNLYPARTSTTLAIQRLIDAGAEIVGKTKLSSFAAREEPTECVDYPAPFNPRGDGYQSPAGSSSGSAVALASYDWLDFAIGSDSRLLLLAD